MAETVREIVRDITGINDLPTLCFSALSSAKEETTTPIRGICESYFKDKVDKVEARFQGIIKQQAIAEDPTKSPSERALASQEVERLRDQNRRSMEVLSRPRGKSF